MDWFAIISGLLLPLLQRCFGGLSSEDPREYLRAHYDPQTGTFDPGLVADCMPQTYRAIRKARRQCPRKDRPSFPQYSHEQVRLMTITNLKTAMDGDDSLLASVTAAAGQLSGVED